MRRILAFAAAALLVASVIGFLAGPAAAAPRAGAGAGAGRGIAVHAGSVPLAGTVNVARLPKISPPHRRAYRIPLRRGPRSSARAASAGRPGPAAVAGPPVAVTPGTPLAGALGDGDNGSVLKLNANTPDMGFAANGTQEVEFVNLVGKIWTGTTPGTAFSLVSFFSPGSPADRLSDPWITWDAGSGRFFAGIFDISLGGEILAVSQTSDPGGSWFLYRKRYPSTAGGITAGGCPDQGKGGVDNNVVGLGFNEFATSGVPGCPPSAPFRGAALEVFNKSEMVAGSSSLDFVFTNPMPAYFSLVPADSLTSTATTEYFASLTSGTGTALHRVTSVGVPPSPVTLTALADITVKGYSNPPGAVQKGTTTKINTGDDRTQNVVALGNMMTVTATVGCTPPGDTTKRSCGRVYEVDNGTSTLTASRTIAKAGTYYFYPAATFTGTGTVGVSVGRSSGTTYGSLYTTAGTWGGALATPALVQAGTATNTTTRYGDYFAAAPQPGTASQFWVAGEIGGTSGTTYKWNTAAGPVTAASHLYWTDFGAGTVMAANLNGTTQQTLVTGQIDPAGVAVDSSHIYWTDEASGQIAGTIMVANLDGTGAATLVTGQIDPAGVAVDNSHIYWGDLNAQTIMRANLDGTGVTTLVTGQRAPFGVAVNSSHIYWSNGASGTIMRANLDGTGVTTLVTGAVEPVGVAVNASHIYWADLGAGTIMQANLDGTGVTTLVTGQNGPGGVAVDSGHIYWTNQDGGSAGTIMKANLDGTGVTTLATSQADPSGLAIGP